MDGCLIFGYWLRENRMRLGKLAQSIALEIGVSTAAISSWEDGRTFPTENKLPKICDAYSANLEETHHRFDRSKEARRKQKETRKNPKINQINSMFNGSISGKSSSRGSFSF